MKNREITVYDNYYSYAGEKKTREFLFEQCNDDGKWASPEDIPDERVFDEMDFQDRELWLDVKAELQSLFDKDVYILTGTCGRRNGPAQGGKFIHSVDDLLSCIDHLDYLRIFDRNGHLYIHGSHHDGSDDYELKRLTHKGYELADRNYFAHDRQLHNTIMGCNFYSALPRYASKVYGL